MVDGILRRRLIWVLAASILAVPGLTTEPHVIGLVDVGVTSCDRMASLSFDEQRVAEPVARTVDRETAIKACKADLEKFPDHSRPLLQLGALVAQRPRYCRRKGGNLAMRFTGSISSSQRFPRTCRS